VEQHLPSVALAAARPGHLPPNQYSNFPAQTKTSSINVILFDILNTPLSDQMFARWQLIEFLKRMPPGRQVALFSLDRQLHMIRGFTMDSQDLASAAAKLRPSPSQLLDEDRVMAQISPVAPSGSLSSPLSGVVNGPPATAAGLQRFLYGESAFQTGERVGWTIQAFNQIARALSGYPGRKNLIWLSEGFPITLSPSFLSLSDLGTLRDYSSILRDSSELLSSGQISVYPSDVRGVVGNVSANEILGSQSRYETETEIAKQTGGEAFYNTNDLKYAVEQSMERGSTYYTVAYAPENRKWDSSAAKINPQHLFQFFRTPPVPRLRIVRLDQRAQLRPRYYLFHLFQKHRSPRLLGVPLESRHHRQCPLLLWSFHLPSIYLNSLSKGST
jgi:VWFA-related protein